MNSRLIKFFSILSIFLIIGLPICFAVQYDLTYDANGNLVSGDGKFRVYNSFNQLWKVYNGSSAAGTLLQEYAYHPLEERVLVKKTYNSSGNLTETVYYWTKNFVTVVNLSGTYNYTYVYHNGELIAQSVNGAKTFFHNDNKGSVVAVSNATGAVIENTSYSPLGEVLTGGNQTRYDYEGKESDSVIGDTDFNARRYKPDFGIFEQPDTLIPNVYDPQSLNRYLFERGNPYKNKDETGHWPQDPFMEIRENWKWGNGNYFGDKVNLATNFWNTDTSWQTVTLREGLKRTPFVNELYDIMMWGVDEQAYTRGSPFGTKEELNSRRVRALLAVPSMYLTMLSFGESGGTLQTIGTRLGEYNLLTGRQGLLDIYSAVHIFIRTTLYEASKAYDTAADFLNALQGKDEPKDESGEDCGGSGGGGDKGRSSYPWIRALLGQD